MKMRRKDRRPQFDEVEIQRRGRKAKQVLATHRRFNAKLRQQRAKPDEPRSMGKRRKGSM